MNAVHRPRPLLFAVSAALAILALLASAGLAGCGGSQVEDGTRTADGKLRIVMYGSSRCGICAHFRRHLDKRSRAYEWHDVLRSREDRKTMVTLARAVRPNKVRIRFPVIVYGGKTLVSPTWTQFSALLDRPDDS